MSLILALLLLAGGASAPQKPAQKAAHKTVEAAWPIESITVEGLKDFTRAQALAALRLKVGQTVTEKDFEAALQRLLTSGAFTRASYKHGPAANGKGYAVTFQVTEVEPKFPIVLEDLGVPPEEVRAALARSDPFFAARVPATEPLMRQYVKAVEEYLASRKQPERVIARVEPDDNGDLRVVIRSAASRPAVARVQFTGSSAIPEAVLENAMNQVAVGIPYTEARLRLALDLQIRPMYDARGLVRVSFPEIHTEPDKDVKGVLVTVKVNEGVPYTLGSADVKGTGLQPAEIRRIATLKSGEVFNQETIDEVMKKIGERMRREGYLHVKSNAERTIDDAAKKVNVVIQVQPGPQYTFAALKIEGLDIIAEPEIRRMWGMKPGRPFNVEYPQHFLDVVRQEGVLDNLGETRAIVNANDERHTVEVKLIFKGAPPTPTPKPLPG
jgi:outer membrane protein insertion porin family